MAWQLWSRSHGLVSVARLPAPVTTARRTVTDIQYYKEVDQSHLHLVEAQSTQRKFLLKLRQRAAWEEQREKRLIDQASRPWESEDVLTDQPSVAGYTPLPVRETTVYDRLLATARESGDCVPQKYKERESSTLLRLLASNIGRDKTAPHYRFHDDPYLIPYNAVQQRDFMLSKEGGRQAARFVRDNHPELFNDNLIEHEPQIKAFMPKAIFQENQASVESLKVFIAGYNVTEAWQTYEALDAAGQKIDNETLQALLELVSYYNGDPATVENYNEIAGLFYTEEITPWDGKCKAELLAQKMEPLSLESKMALMAGSAKFGNNARCWSLYLECATAQEPLNVTAYNAAILSNDPKTLTVNTAWANVELVLKEMRARKVAPDSSTLDCLFQVLNKFPKNPAMRQRASDLAFPLLAEFKQIGVPVWLSVYVKLIYIHRSREDQRGDLVKMILDELQGKDLTPKPNAESEWFFCLCMEGAKLMEDVALAYKIHDILMFGTNEIYLSDAKRSAHYYANFLDLVLKKEPLAVTMEFLSKFVPHVYPAKLDFYKELVGRVRREGALQYIPKIWTDLTISSFCGANRMLKNEAIDWFLGLILDIDTILDEDKGASEGVVTIAKEAFSEISTGGRRGVSPVSGNAMALPILEKILQIALREKNSEFLLQVLEFSFEWSRSLPRPISPELFATITDELIELREDDLLYKSVIYCSEATMVNAVEISQKICSVLELKPQEKIAINQLLSHDSMWVPLEL
ncbi:hypothetical protein TCAL_02901 [Tigriopus californicus]|uniref:Uncharacterized protein n=1 Tax=Tigriopus californicus TaxID=6832 RepID=A0A553NZS6_TIGCA|nr:small ribosomal subunit protein mS39-like [Tigriopus californicus]TRY70872.1 hypothetical protein TCAL_02901 [Tigriopus californicus]